jgi:hypothetical protein
MCLVVTLEHVVDNEYLKDRGAKHDLQKKVCIKI